MIELQHLDIGYPEYQVLKNVSLSFPKGKITVLLGPNGCGKSSLLKTALGLLPKQNGSILYDGTDIDRMSPNQIARKASYLSQSRNIPCITARRMVLHGRFPYLSYPRRYRSEDYTIVHAALERVNALELANRQMNSLSGGQRQKVYLAMALAQETETVFMDEPTTYLDVCHQLEVMEIAKDLAREGRAVVLVLHDLGLALQAANQVAVLAEGRLIQVGSPEEVYTSGILNQVFGVEVCRVKTDNSWHYYCQVKKGE